MPLRHLIVLIANTHRAIPKGSSLQPQTQRIVASARSQRDRRFSQILCRIWLDVIGTKRPASRDRFEGAVRQTHHMREIERLPRQITPLAGCEVRTNLLFTMSNRTGGEPRCSPQTLKRMTFFSAGFTSTRHPFSPGFSPRRRSDNPCGLRGATILRIARRWWSRTGSNRRHPACKAGALPAELRPLITPLRRYLVEEIDNPCGLRSGGPGRT